MTELRNIPVPDELFAVRAEQRRLKEREEVLKRLIRDNPDIRTGGDYLAEVKVVTQQQTDWKELKAMYPEFVDIIAEFTHPREDIRIEVKAITADGEIVSARKIRAIGGSQ